VKFIGGFCEFTQQAFTCFGSEAVRDANQVGFFTAGGSEEIIDRDSRTEENGPPAGKFGQPQEIGHTRDMDAFAKGSSDDGFHKNAPFSAPKGE